MTASPERSADQNAREIVLRRVFAAPRELVFRVWTDPMQLGMWYGPNGFTTTTHSMELRPNGYWRYTMHGPDGTDYENWIRYITVERPGLLVFEHGANGIHSIAHFQGTITFVENAGQTRVVMRSLFPSAEARDEVVRRYGAIEGGKQTLQRFADHLDTLSAAVAQAQKGFRFVRRFAAPRQLVFAAWTDPKHLQHWWGPHGFTNPQCVFEARPNGRVRIDMRGPDGTVYPMGGQVVEIRPPDHLVFHCFPLDEQEKPLFSVRNEVHFNEEAGHTTVMLEATVTQITSQGSPHLGGMEVGWSQSLERLGTLIAELLAAR